MANLTITVDDHVLKRARLRALEQGTSVNALLREYLIRYAGAASAHAKAVEGLIQLPRTARAGRGRRSCVRPGVPRTSPAEGTSSCGVTWRQMACYSAPRFSRSST